MKLLLVGATGLVGREVLRLALADERVTQVITPTRRKLSPDPKLEAPVIDFSKLPEDASWWAADAMICTLGTTIRVAGSQEAFYQVDHDFPLETARLAHRHGTQVYALNSAMGADEHSSIFYNRVKGELERDLRGVGFQSLTFVRPGLIGGNRDEFRFGEKVATVFLTVFSPLLPKRWRINPATNIAKSLLDAAIEAKPGVHVVASDQLI